MKPSEEPPCLTNEALQDPMMLEDARNIVHDGVEDEWTVEQHEEERMKLRKQVEMLDAKHENLEEEFGKMEQEMIDKATALERIIGTVSGLEKRNKALIKRQAAQEEEFELERQEWKDTERTLQYRIEDLEKQFRTCISAQIEPAVQTDDSSKDALVAHDQDIMEADLVAQVKTVAQLRSRLADMSESQLSLTEKHTALCLQVHTLEHEVAERTAECYRLREENEGFEILLRERTLDGRVYDADIFGDMTDDDMSEEPTDTEGTSDTDTQAESGSSNKVEVFEGINSPNPPGEQRSSRRRKALNLAQEFSNNIESVSSRMNASPIVDESSQEHDTKEGQTTGKIDYDPILDSLRGEVKALSDANKALRLYCSKILDRILLHEDEENFLVDVSGSLNRKTHTRTTLRKVAGEGGTRERSLIHKRPTVEQQTFQAPGVGDSSRNGELRSDQAQRNQRQRRLSQASIEHKDDSKRSLPSIQVESATTRIRDEPRMGKLRPLSIVAKKEEREKEAKKAESANEKRLRRGFSLDWRSLSGARSASPEQSPKPDDLGALANVSSENALVTYPSSRPAITNSRSYDKKLQIIEDDDEDRIERERLSTALRLLGVTPNGGSSPSSLTVAEDLAITRQSSNTSPRPSATAFSRFSAFFGRNTNDSSPSAIFGIAEQPGEMSSNSPDFERQKLHRQKSEGQTTGQEKSPLQSKANLTTPKGGFADLIAERRSASKERRKALPDSQVANVSDIAESSGSGQHRRTTGGDESLSTLWSLGSEVSDI
ncbi:hypothetical protein QFC19_002508 [Naganishia cerealis]|uniref:Uncharacterized protein n=1 Tax=Naganishia cerealis TaxID=610337 RepID=A0ACC2WAC2_9TREE|nr:hypothetical protein QFC19_002508 [Naganishia cerealis]